MIAWKTARTPHLTAIAALALGTPCCGGHAQDEAEPEKHELLVLDALDQPAPQVRALIAGQVVTTDDEGRAELGELPAQYDAVLVAGSSASLDDYAAGLTTSRACGSSRPRHRVAPNAARTLTRLSR